MPEQAVFEQIAGGVRQPQRHDSAWKHVSGEALYIDDLSLPEGSLLAAIGVSERAHARLRKVDLSRVRVAPGVVSVFTAKDIPGENNHGPVVHDDPIFAEETVEYAGQSLFAVVAESVDAARRGGLRAG